MKRNKSKLSSWIWLSVICVLFAASVLAAFMPVSTDKGTYNGFFGSQSYATDLSDKIIVNYGADLDGATSSQISTTCKTIESVLQKKGYVSATAKAVGTDTIQVEMSKPKTSDGLKSALTLLGSYGIGVGSFELKTTNSSTADALIVGKDHVKSVSTTSNQGYYYTVVQFNDEGKALIANYKSTTDSPTIYVFLGGTVALSGTNFANYFVGDDLYIGGFYEADAADSYELMIKMGSMPITLESASARNINYQTNSKATETRILLWSLCLVVVAAFLVWTGVRHGAYAFLASLFANGIAISFALLLTSIMDWIEISSVGIAVFAICIAVLNSLILAMFEKMLNEKKNGKNMQMSVESGLSASLLPGITACVLMAVLGLFVAVAFKGIVCAAASIVAVFGVLSAIATYAIACQVFKILLNVGTINKHTTKLGDEE